MGTNNFHSRCGKYYTILMDREEPVLDDDGKETGETQTVSADKWELDDEVDFLHEQMKEYTSKAKFSYDTYDGVHYGEYGYRNDDSLYGVMRTDKEYAGITVEIHCSIILNSGYYEGATWDYEFKFYVDSIYFEDIDDVEDTYREHYADYNDNNIGMATIQAKHASRWARRTYEAMQNGIEEVLAKCSTEMKVVASFSNGETWYASKEKPADEAINDMKKG